MTKFALLALCTTLGVALAGSTGGSIQNGAFHVRAGATANLRFEFTLAKNVLFNRAGSSELSFTDPFTNKPVSVEVTRGEAYPSDPNDYFQRLEAITQKLSVPANAKPGVYPVKLEASMFLCEALLKVCYVDEASGAMEIRVGRSGRDQPVRLEYATPQR
jgi:hypothetical protein